LEALVHAPRGYNDELQMTLDVARTHSPILHLPKRAIPLVVTYGGKETDEFRRQSQAFAKAWTAAGLTCELIECPEDNHFTIGRTFCDPGSALNKAVLKLIGLK
jgi:arylformamidase